MQRYQFTMDKVPFTTFFKYLHVFFIISLKIYVYYENIPGFLYTLFFFN